MCGLGALFAYHPAARPPATSDVQAMAARLHRRGPDGGGQWWSRDGQLALVHRRLAIIDPHARSDQPMVSADSRYVVVFNGEIYNHAELRQALVAAGRAFRTASDTEVLLEGFAHWGIDVFARLRGMFAVIIFDTQCQELWLARDGFGIKPLYVADDGWTLRAASTVKTLLAAGASDERDLSGEIGFWLWGSVPEPFTLYQQIRAVPPGVVICRDRYGERERHAFFDLSNAILGAQRTASNGRLAAAVDDSVAAHLQADVPVAIFLSAGVDSAAILAAAVRQGIKPTAITVAFEEFKDDAHDESPAAAQAALRAGVQHHVWKVSRDDFLAQLPAALDAMDQPSIDGINTYFVAGAAQAMGFKVALSGLGADELLAGYPSFTAVPRYHRWLGPLAWLPGLAAVAETTLPPLLSKAGISPKAAALPRLAKTIVGAYQAKRGLYAPHELRAQYDRNDWQIATERLAHNAFVPPFELETRWQVSLLEARQYMRNQLLRDADWAGMAHSVEIRVPFVDTALWQRVAGLAAPQTTKTALAATTEDVLDDAGRARAKTGFTTPVSQWISAPQHVPWARSWGRQVMEQFACAR